ncbi:MAG: hypothetical protein A2Z88_02775 [Omnitrophica WOR_2 bacterium GWA2_47_8]|nr:MAG: hypothetical protein A2Z88_02775 [Omnitrophica WOR_2 bacterium GWA2_47_8]
MSDGTHKTYYDTGEKQYESHYKDGELQGLTTEYEKNGTVKAKYQFEHDVLISKQEKEPKRDMGRMTFLVRPWFWLGLLALGGGFWFFFTKVILKKYS